MAEARKSDFHPPWFRTLTPEDELTRFTKLMCEPFEVGSFSIPARFESEPVEIVTDNGLQKYETQQIANRFADILGAIESRRSSLESPR